MAEAEQNGIATWQFALTSDAKGKLPLRELAGNSFAHATDCLAPIGFVPPGYDHLEIQSLGADNGRLTLRELLFIPLHDHARGKSQLEDAGPFCVDDRGQVWGVLDEDQLFAWRGADRKIDFHWNNRPAMKLQGVSRINALASGEKWTVAGTRAGQLAVISQQTMEVQRIVDGPGGPVTACAMDAHGHCIVGTQEGKVRILDPANGKLVTDLPGFRREIAAIDSSDDGQWLIIAGTDSGWRLMQRSGGEYTTWLEQTSRCASARICGDGSMLVVLNHGEYAPRIWRLDRLREFWTNWNLP